MMRRGGMIVEGAAVSLHPGTSTEAPRPFADRGTAAAVPESLRERLDVDVYDVAILGAGCAGLSSCLALLEAGMTGSIVLVDARQHYRDDRTWCYWDVEPTAFSHLARAGYRTWFVRDESGPIRVAAPATPYLYLAATDFYDFALERLAAYPNVELRLGEKVDEVEDHAPHDDLYGLVTVITETGPLRARHVIDSRGFAVSSAEATQARASSTWIPQQFVGLHIAADRPVFDPAECRLMDFGVDQSGGLRFVYVLPTSPFEALVENVYLADTAPDYAGHRREIEAYLLAEFGLNEDQFSVTGDERGYIPMTDHRFLRHPSAHVTRLGMLGGATRPSTGYTFLAIQRSCRDLVGRLVEGEPEAVEQSCSLLDATFLRFLADYPERAPRVFGLLFRCVDTASLVRFLTERSGARDHLRLVVALPKWPFLRAAVGVLASRLRQPSVRVNRARRN